jgi:hypothetical protein
MKPVPRNHDSATKPLTKEQQMPPTTTQNNGSRPKLELVPNQPVKLKLLKPAPFTGENSRGKYYLYSVVDSDGIEMAYFASEEIHNLIQSNKLKAGAEIQLTKKDKAVEFAIIGQPKPEALSSSAPDTDNLKAILLQCVKDAAEVIRDSGIQLGNDELQKLATTLFIQRAKAA